MAIIPTVRCRNMKRSLAVYTGVLDFERVDGDDELADPSFSVLARDGGRQHASLHPNLTLMAAKRRRSARDLERTYSRAQFVAKLRRLADALEAEGAFAIQVAGERLRIPATAEFNIEHERSGGREELEFQLRWSPEG
jgi:amphi-Trp domain-containing protein